MTLSINKILLHNTASGHVLTRISWKSVVNMLVCMCVSDFRTGTRSGRKVFFS